MGRRRSCKERREQGDAIRITTTMSVHPARIAVPPVRRDLILAEEALLGRCRTEVKYNRFNLRYLCVPLVVVLLLHPHPHHHHVIILLIIFVLLVLALVLVLTAILEERATDEVLLVVAR